MDELHDGDILKELFAKKDKLIVSQLSIIASLETQLFNERLKNDNLSALVKARDNNLTNPTED